MIRWYLDLDLWKRNLLNWFIGLNLGFWGSRACRDAPELPPATPVGIIMGDQPCDPEDGNDTDATRPKAEFCNRFP